MLFCAEVMKGQRDAEVSQETVEVQGKKRQTWETAFQCTGTAKGAD